MDNQQTFHDKKPPSIPFVVIGILLVCLVAIIVLFTTLFIAIIYTDITGNDVFQRWNFLDIVSFSFILIFSYYYFSTRRISRKKLLITHSLIFIVFLSIITWISLIEFREQQKVLNRYQLLLHSIKNGEKNSVDNLLLPTYSESHIYSDITNGVWLEQALKVGSNLSPYTVHVQMLRNRAIIVPDTQTSRWYHPNSGFFVGMEKYQGEWYYAGNGGLYLSD